MCLLSCIFVYVRTRDIASNMTLLSDLLPYHDMTNVEAQQLLPTSLHTPFPQENRLLYSRLLNTHVPNHRPDVTAATLTQFRHKPKSAIVYFYIALHKLMFTHQTGNLVANLVNLQPAHILPCPS